MPGMVDTHWHMWTTLLRNMSGNKPEHGYFPTTTAVGNVYNPRDMYYGTLLSSAEALFSGITTVHDWCHNVITPQHAEEDIRALQETGIRARFCYGPARRMPATEAINTDDLERFHRAWASFSNEGLLTLGLGWRGVQAPFRLPGMASSSYGRCRSRSIARSTTPRASSVSRSRFISIRPPATAVTFWRCRNRVFWSRICRSSTAFSPHPRK